MVGLDHLNHFNSLRDESVGSVDAEVTGALRPGERGTAAALHLDTADTGGIESGKAHPEDLEEPHSPLELDATIAVSGSHCHPLAPAGRADVLEYRDGTARATVSGQFARLDQNQGAAVCLICGNRLDRGPDGGPRARDLHDVGNRVVIHERCRDQLGPVGAVGTERWQACRLCGDVQRQHEQGQYEKAVFDSHDLDSLRSRRNGVVFGTGREKREVSVSFEPPT